MTPPPPGRINTLSTFCSTSLKRNTSWPAYSLSYCSRHRTDASLSRSSLAYASSASRCFLTRREKSSVTYTQLGPLALAQSCILKIEIHYFRSFSERSMIVFSSLPLGYYDKSFFEINLTYKFKKLNLLL